MMKEDIYCALIWDTELNKFIGIFTIRDFLNLIKVLYEKVNQYLAQNNKCIINIKTIVSHLFQRNRINLDALDIIMENPETKHNSETKSEKSDYDLYNDDMQVDNDSNNTHSIEHCIKSYKDFFKIFEHINLNDYLSDIHPVRKLI
jgi:hypothetical protein